MGVYRKKPVTVTAFRLAEDNFESIAEWCGGRYADPERVLDGRKGMDIPTLEGIMLARMGDWIVRGVEGEFYPVKHEIFLKTYEAA